MASRSRPIFVRASALPALLAFLLAAGALPTRPAAPTSSPPQLPGVYLTAPQAGDAAAIALAYVRANPAAHGLTDADLAELRVSDRYTSSHTGVTHLYFTQQLGGIDVFNGVLNVNVMPDGRILNVGTRFVGDLKRRVAATAPSLTAACPFRL